MPARHAEVRCPQVAVSAVVRIIEDGVLDGGDGSGGGTGERRMAAVRLVGHFVSEGRAEAPPLLLLEILGMLAGERTGGGGGGIGHLEDRSLPLAPLALLRVQLICLAV